MLEVSTCQRVNNGRAKGHCVTSRDRTAGRFVVAVDIEFPPMNVNELSPVRLPPGPCCLANQDLHRHSRNRRTCCSLLSIILPDKIARRVFPSTPGTPPISIDDPSGSGSTNNPDTHNVLHVNCVSSCDSPSRTSYIPCLQLLLIVRQAV